MTKTIWTWMLFLGVAASLLLSHSAATAEGLKYDNNGGGESVSDRFLIRDADVPKTDYQLEPKPSSTLHIEGGDAFSYDPKAYGAPSLLSTFKPGGSLGESAPLDDHFELTSAPAPTYEDHALLVIEERPTSPDYVPSRPAAVQQDYYPAGKKTAAAQQDHYPAGKKTATSNDRPVQYHPFVDGRPPAGLARASDQPMKYVQPAVGIPVKSDGQLMHYPFGSEAQKHQAAQTPDARVQFAQPAASTPSSVKDDRQLQYFPFAGGAPKQQQQVVQAPNAATKFVAPPVKDDRPPLQYFPFAPKQPAPQVSDARVKLGGPSTAQKSDGQLLHYAFGNSGAPKKEAAAQTPEVPMKFAQPAAPSLPPKGNDQPPLQHFPFANRSPSIQAPLLPSKQSQSPKASPLSGRRPIGDAKRQGGDGLDTNGHMMVSFCVRRPDGFYRHPANCSRILQCFGKEVFEYPSCSHDLAFDEAKQACDYRDRVKGCTTSTAIQRHFFPLPQRTTPGGVPIHGCNGHVHGDHIANPKNCSAFYRCVWDRLVPMTCAPGTVFNPRLGLCDYPDQVPGCSKPASK